MASTITVDNIIGKTVASNVKLPPGSIIQVEHTKTTTTTNNNTSNWVNVLGLNISITPKYNDSKILVFYGVSYYKVGGVTDAISLRVQRTINGSTTTIHSDMHGIGYQGDNASAGDFVNIMHLDSPSTTDIVSYQIQLKPTYELGQNVYVNSTYNSNAVESQITLMEIAQ